MGVLHTSPLNLVPMQPEYREYRLRCRFVIGAAPCHKQVSPIFPMCRHLESAAYEAGCQFFEEMERQGWESSNGRLKVTGGPFPATVLATSDPAPVRPVRGRGPHPRFGPAYDNPVMERPTVSNVADWEYELSGLFIRKLLPTVATVSAIAAIEAKRKREKRGR